MTRRYLIYVKDALKHRLKSKADLVTVLANVEKELRPGELRVVSDMSIIQGEPCIGVEISGERTAEELTAILERSLKITPGDDLDFHVHEQETINQEEGTNNVSG